MFSQRELNNVIMNSKSTQTLGDIFKKSTLNAEFLPTNIGGDAQVKDFGFIHCLGTHAHAILVQFR